MHLFATGAHHCVQYTTRDIRSRCNLITTTIVLLLLLLLALHLSAACQAPFIADDQT